MHFIQSRIRVTKIIHLLNDSVVAIFGDNTALKSVDPKKEMKPFWHRLQDRIFKPGYDQEAYLERGFNFLSTSDLLPFHSAIIL